MYPIKMHLIKQKLITEHKFWKVYDQVLSDLDTLEKMANEIVNKLPNTGSMVSDTVYLKLTAIPILIISHLEYLLKSIGVIEKQWQIKEIISNSKCIDRLEKDHLIYLFLVRHTLAHNGGHFDEKFRKKVNEEIKRLKIDIPSNKSLSPIPPELFVKHINLIRKLIFLDIANCSWTEEEKEIITESLK